MKLIAFPALLTLTAVLLRAPAAGAATVASSATLSGFTISLLDLNPGDGVASAISFVGEGGPPFSGFATGGITFRSLADGSELYTVYYNESGPVAPFSDASGSANEGGTTISSALVSGPDRLGPHLFTAQGSATALPGTQVSYNATAAAPGYISLTYSVTPYTLVRFDGVVSLQASIGGSVGTEHTASASAELFAYGLGASAGLGSSQSSRDLVGVTANESLPNSTLSRAMSVSFLNNSNVGITGQIKASVYAGGMTSAVPEVSAAWLALVGGGVVFGRALQRRARIAKRACTNSQA